MSRRGSTPVAIVGMGCRFAGAEDLQGFWALSAEGRNGFSPVPADRWSNEAFFDANPRAKDKSYVPTGGFIKDIRSFPAVALGVPPRRVEVMDPQQRMALEVAIEAAHDGGVSPSELPRNTGVFMGVTATEYRNLMTGRMVAQLMASGALGEAPEDLDALANATSRIVPPRPFTAPGGLANMIAATVAQELRITGPAYTTDAACASGLVAVADAVYALRAGRIDAALAGGVYVCITPEHHLAFSRIGAMSRRGECLPFDARADGFLQGDGCAVVMLKRLEDARRDGDRVYAVIEGVGMNNDGGGDGPMAPVMSGQVDCVRRAWDDAGMEASNLGFVETHGTGTEVGDRIEFAGLQAVFGPQVETGQIALGSCKANVGHTMSAAGIAGLVKAALAVHHAAIPPMGGFQAPKAELGLEVSAFHVPTSLEPWTTKERVAAVSSFGFGGTNVHTVLRSEVSPARETRNPLQLVCFSAADTVALRALAERTADVIEADDSITPAQVARAWACRDQQPARLGVVCGTRDELIAQLRDPSIIGTAPETTPRLAFMYPGQGAQRTGMLTDIKARFPRVTQTLAALDEAIDVRVSDLLYPHEDDDADEARDRLTATEHCQPALLAVGVALTRLLSDVGIEPDVVCGHSVGEFTAAVAAGVMSPEAGLNWVRERGLAMARMRGDRGAMVAIGAGSGEVEKLLVDGAVIANVNHPRQTVVSGGTDAVAEVSRCAEAAGLTATRLDVSHGFHSPVFEALDLDRTVDAIALSDPTIEIVSCIKDGIYRDANDARMVFKDHATAPVQFTRTLEYLNADILLQVGAGGPLMSFARGSLRGTGVTVLGLASKNDHDGGRSLLETLARLFTLGVDLTSGALCTSAQPASLPPRQLPREVYWAVRETAVAMTLSSARASVGQTGGTGAAVEALAADAAAALTSDDIAGRVIEAVAQASAYPATALRQTMRLVEDLGFDSMMLAELGTVLTRAVPGMDGLPQELLINSPTIGDLIAYAEAPTSLAPPVDDDAPLARYGLTWHAAELTAGPTRSGAVVRRVLSEAPIALPPVLAGEAALPGTLHELATELESAASRGERPDVVVLCRDDDPLAEGVAGFVRAMSREWPDVVCKCVRMAAPLDESVLELERNATCRAVDVRYTTDGRFVRGTTPLLVLEPWKPTSNDVVLVTGGSRGIGAALADRLEGQGATVLRLGRAQADVCDRAALTAWLAEQPRVTTLVHAAGLLADGPLGSVPRDRSEAVYAVKTTGLINAISAIGPSLERAVVVGSWSGRFGNRHQAWYSAANAMAAGIVEALPPFIRGVCAEFGPWIGSDMAESIPEVVRQAMRAEGVDFVGTGCGLDALCEELGAGQGTVVRGRRVPAAFLRTAQGHELSVDSHPFLADHAIDGKPVLPLVGAAALLADAAALPAPFELTDLWLYQGVSAPASVSAVVDGESATLKLGNTLAYRATIRPGGAVAIEVVRRSGGQAPELSLAEFYANVTFHGPLLQGIVSIDGVGDDFACATIRAGRRADWILGDDRPWRIDPLALDSALQLCAYVAWTRYGRAGTPVSLARHVQLRDWPAGDTLSCQVTFGPSEDDRFTADVAFFTDDGELVSVTYGVVAQLRAVPAETGEGETPTGYQPAAEHGDVSAWPEYLAIKQRQAEVAALGLQNPYFDVHQGTARDTTLIDGKEIINYSSYNYLGLSGDDRVMNEVEQAMRRYGTSVSASRVASGERPFHGALEAGLAEAQGAEAALVFASGHATNVTVIGHLFGPKDLILHDELIHDSCLQGIKLSGAARRAFRHDDPEHLAEQLALLRPHYERALILIEGVYSMDGDVANLPAYLELKQRWGCLIMVDEAHSFGTIGKTGRGIGEYFGVDTSQVDIFMGTLSKSLASMGGWIAGSHALIEYLRYTTPGFVFAAGQTPTLGQAALSSLRLMNEEPWRVERLQHNSRFFCDALKQRGIDTGDALGASPVVPVITRDSAVALILSERLLEQGINAKPIIFPAVAEDAARLRFFLTSLHTEKQLTYTADCIAATLAQARARMGKGS